MLYLDKEIVVPDLARWRRERMPEYPDTAYVKAVIGHAWRGRLGHVTRGG